MTRFKRKEMVHHDKLVFFAQLFSHASEGRTLIMKSRRSRKAQSYRKRLEYLRKQHSRARAKLFLVLLSVLSPLYAPKVAPITEFPDEEVNSASTRLVNTHTTAFPTERTLMQRHSVRVVPVAEAHCSWKGDSFNYFVYGQENRVYAPDYPQKCCCGCTLL